MMTALDNKLKAKFLIHQIESVAEAIRNNVSSSIAPDLQTIQKCLLDTSHLLHGF